MDEVEALKHVERISRVQLAWPKSQRRDDNALEQIIDIASQGLNRSSDVMNAIETAALLDFNPVTIRQKALSGEIPARKIGKEWRFSRGRLLRWIGGE